MSRKDYDEIKEKFGKFINIFRTRNVEELYEVMIADVAVNLEPIRKYNDGSCHTIKNLGSFIIDYPKTDVLNQRIYNYVCRLNKDEAQQTAYVVVLALDLRDDGKPLDYFFYTKMFANHWINTSDGWRMDSVKMDVYPQMGTLRERFEEKWLFEDVKAILKPGVHYPCIMPEIDSPWDHLLCNAYKL